MTANATEPGWVNYPHLNAVKVLPGFEPRLFGDVQMIRKELTVDEIEAMPGNFEETQPPSTPLAAA